MNDEHTHGSSEPTKYTETLGSSYEPSPVVLHQNTSSSNSFIPLAEKVRPKDISEIIGQDEVIGEKSVLRKLLNQKVLPSLILWGPPGTGKTTIGRLLAKFVNYYFVQLSATGSGVNDVKKAVDTAKNHRFLTGQRTAMFIDEIHRFNKLQQVCLYFLYLLGYFPS